MQVICSKANFTLYFFPTTNKINISTTTNYSRGKCSISESGWGTCKREPLDKATLVKYSNPKPNENNIIVSEYNKVLEKKLQEVERKRKELEQKLAALQLQKKEINQSIAEKKVLAQDFTLVSLDILLLTKTLLINVRT